MALPFPYRTVLGYCSLTRKQKLLDIEKVLAYDNLGRTHWWLTSKYAVLRDVLETQVQNAKTLSPVLDIGCAGGVFLEQLRSDDRRLYGVDREQQILRASKHRFISFAAADAASLPFRQATFSLVTAIDILEHLGDDLLALREIRRVLKPGGWLLLCVPAFMVLFGKHDRIFGHHRRYSKKDLLIKLEQCGYATQKSSYIQPLFFLPLWVKRKFFSPSDDVWGDFAETKRMGFLLHRLLAFERIPLRYVNFPIGPTLIALSQKR